MKTDKKIINFALKTEYSFKETFGHLEKTILSQKEKGVVGVADINNTFAHVKLEKYCKANDMKPIFGVRLTVINKPEEKERKRRGPEYIFIAKNNNGLKEIYELVKIAYDKFYYFPQIGIDDLLKVSNDVFVICECPETIERIDYISLSPSTPRLMLDFDIPKIALSNNRYPTPDKKEAYQVLAGARKWGDGYRYQFNDQTYQQHILSTSEWYRIWGVDEAIENTHILIEQCEVEIPRASMVKFNGSKTIEQCCMAGARKLNIDIINDGEYRQRYERELKLIKEKDYGDYFLIVAEMILKAKKIMLVGPGRGSSAGSLVCYLMEITTVNPIQHGLLFERFIDITRFDLPDIDVDFPDVYRQKVVKDLIKTHNAANVVHISNINRMAAKSAIGEVAMSLGVPKYRTEEVKDSIVDRSGGDARAAVAASDTLYTTDIGKALLKDYPGMELVKNIEGHASHAGKHAAGIIVCNEGITNFAGVNSRDGTLMMDKGDAEYKNLLKIDVLGLRTLSILQECARLLGLNFDFYYNIPLDDKKSFQMLDCGRNSGIFQFEGRAVEMLTQRMGVENFNDIVALTALARPGPLHSGAAAIYVARRSGEKEIEYISNHPTYVAVTKETQGVIVYQEQLMSLCKICGMMTMEEVSEIRKAASKTKGEEFFNQYKKSFLNGAIGINKIDETNANEIWENMMTFGSWGMNKSHSVSYGYISYWCAYAKAHYPLEFAAANLNNSKDEETSIKLLRDSLENEGIVHIPVDPDESEINWTIKNGKLLGGLTNIKGIAEKKAAEIIRNRKALKLPTPAMLKKLSDPKTPFDILYPVQHYFGRYYDNYADYGLIRPPQYIKDIQTTAGEYTFLGLVYRKDLRDLNEYNEVMKRNGEVLKSNSLQLRIVIQDDTSQIMCTMNRMTFPKLNGAKWNDTLIVDKSYVIIRGVVKEGWRIVEIKAIHELGKIGNE